MELDSFKNTAIFKDKDMVCFFCGRTADAAWRSDTAGKYIFVCDLCALEILPKLIVDACYLSALSDHKTYKRNLETILINYWEQAALRFSETKENALRRLLTNQEDK